MKRVRKRSIYLLPNFFTTMSLLLGFYAIILSINSHFINASIAIFIASLFDSLDGRVARLINAQSAFGAQYDSLSDLVSFGMAPALVAYNFTISPLDAMGWSKMAWLSGFVFCACVALRLARFNVQSENPKEKDLKLAKSYFFGMPCPPSAVLVASTIWLASLYNLHQLWMSIVIVIELFIVAFLMVSTIRFRSFKDIDLTRNVRFTLLFVMLLIIVAISWRPAESIFTISLLYALSGVLPAIFRRKAGR